MADKSFTLFHLNLVPIQQLHIETIDLDREKWLRRALSDNFEFEHRGGGTLFWTPHGNIDECIFGVLQRTKQHEHHKSPQEGGEEVVSEEWQGAYVLIDPTYHDIGQRVAVENDVVGQPTALLKSLVQAINEKPEKPYQTVIEPLWDASRFWAFAKRHENVLRKITFDFVVPNMWNTEGNLDADLKDTGQQTGAERVKVEMKSQNGLFTDNQKVRDGVDYTERGAGALTATAQNGERFSSTKRPRISKIPLVHGNLETVKSYFGKLKGRILGHDQIPPVGNPDRDDNDTSVD